MRQTTVVRKLPPTRVCLFDFMPLTKKGKEIASAMKKQYGAKKGKQVFYASKNKGTIKGVEKKHA